MIRPLLRVEIVPLTETCESNVLHPARETGGVAGEPFARPPGEGSVLGELLGELLGRLLVIPSPEKPAERSFFGPSRVAGGVRRKAATDHKLST